MLAAVFNTLSTHTPGSLSRYFSGLAAEAQRVDTKRALFSQLRAELDRGGIDDMDAWQEQACWRIAESVHGKTTRRDGKPYMSHIRAVYNAPDYLPGIEYDHDQKCLAIVHDTPEDSPWRVKDFAKLGFGARFCAGLDGMSKREGEKYFDYIERCSQTCAIDVKLADNNHNWRDSPKPASEMRYRVSFHYLRAVKHGVVEAGSSTAGFAAGHGYYNQDLFAQDSSRPVIEDYSVSQDKAHLSSIGAPRAV